MAKMKIGIAGIGMMFDLHLKAFQTLPNAEIIGAARDFYGDQKQQAQQREKLAVACQNAGIKAYRDFDEMVADPELTALIITSINSYHFEQIMKALNHGKHILVEKPVVTDIAQIDLIQKKSAETGVLVFPGHNFVYRGAVQQAKEIIRSGRLGRITYASFLFSHSLRPEHANGWRKHQEIAGGGALIDSGHHIVYQSLYLMGMPHKIHGFKSKLILTQMDGEDMAQVNLLYPDGTLGCIMMSWTSDYHLNINGTRIMGTDGNLLINDDGLFLSGEKMNDDVTYQNSFANQARAFVKSITDGTPPLSTLEDVRNTLKIVYGAYESSDQDKVIIF